MLTQYHVHVYRGSILADRTDTQYDRLLASSCRPSVRPFGAHNNQYLAAQPLIMLKLILYSVHSTRKFYTYTVPLIAFY